MTEETTTAVEQTPAPEQTDATNEATTEATNEVNEDQIEGQAAAHRSFESMNLDPEIKRALDEMGYDEPMEVQAVVYDKIVGGRDLMAQARTGTGKTAAFGIPIAQMLSRDERGVQALILAPTRELALQVAMELGNIAQHKNITVVPVYGGAPIGKQIDALKAGAQVVSGTPGRILDHIGRGTLKTDKIKMLVLDECDEMLSMGFQEEIEKIIATLPPTGERQTLLFSATIPKDIERIARRHMTEPEAIQLSSDDDISVDQIDHSYFVVSGMARTRDLLKVLEVEKPTAAIVFCNTRSDTTTVATFLRKHGYDAEALSSDLSQSDRERVMKRARDKNLRFLVATDVAARGIDIANLSHVINYAFPESPQVYVHRTGRTGRAGKEGKAISLVGPREIGSFYYLKLLYKIRPRERELPTDVELSTLREGKRYEEVLARAPNDCTPEYRSLARRLWQSPEGERVVGALLQQLLEGEARAPQAKAAREREPRRERERESRREPQREREPKREREPRPEREPKREREPQPESEARNAGEDRSRRDTRNQHGPETSENGDEPRKRRRRRRRERPGDTRRNEAPPATQTEAAPAAKDKKPKAAPTPAVADSESGDEPREFWEAWADEKTIQTETKVPEAKADAAEPTGDKPADDKPAENKPSEGTTRLYVNVGRREEVGAEEVRAMLAEGLSEQEAGKLGNVQVRNTHCYVRVPDDLADKVIETAVGKKVGERDVVVERARK